MANSQKIKTWESKYRKIYQDYFQDLYVFAKSLTRSDELARDAVSEVFVALWKAGTDLGRIKDIKSYLLVSVKNECIKMIYRGSNEFLYDDETSLDQIEEVNPEDVLLGKELLELIESAVASLPDQCRLIFDLAKNKQMSYNEISKELGISASTVGTQMSRAVQAIRMAILDKYDADSFEGWSNLAMALSILGVFAQQ